MLFRSHWIDPTSLEVLDTLIDAGQRLPVMFVLTHRPGFESPWGGHAFVTELRLSHLSRSSGAAIDAFGTERAAAAIEEAMDTLRHQPRLVVKLPPEAAEALQPRIAAMCRSAGMPFDAKRMIYGGFKSLVELRAGC